MAEQHNSYRQLRRRAMKDLRHSGKTLQEIGDIFGLTRERVRQIVGNRRVVKRVDRKLSPETIAFIRTEQHACDRAAAFWSMVDKTAGADACWPWLGRKMPTGYGAASRYLGGYAHRASFLLSFGHLPAEGKWVLHRCDNPICVNPAHLYEGTPKNNTDDAIAKNGGHFGRQYPMPKMSEGERAAKRKAYNQAHKAEKAAYDKAYYNRKHKT